MKVHKLIEILQTFPEDMQVTVQTPEDKKHTVTGVAVGGYNNRKIMLRVHKKETT